MPDYGHPLEFGSFITPRSDRPADVVALAKVTEAAGLEYATFQDHPYQPAFLDTWTLLSWVAAETTTLRVAPNVANLPLRPPAVLARAAASLDRLSGGRVELGLGAGGFRDAIAAMGGPRLTAGQSVDALTEAIDVIRAIWDGTERGGVRVDGEHHRVMGAKRGPEPAHEIAIWLGAYKPRMLRLTGRAADGWLPSLSYLDADAIGPAHAAIDAAARDAGRDPREIRRLLNVPAVEGPPETWVEQLLPLALEHGFSTFIVSSDDPGTIERFGREVAPALRERVADAREATGTARGPARGSRALAERAKGIDYDALPTGLAAGAVEPGDGAYARVRSTYVHRGAPGLVLRPSGPGEVAEALAFARGQDVPLAIRSGGHGIGGRATNDGGIVIDLGALNGVEVLDPATGAVRVGPGARWGDVAAALAPHGLGMSSGDYGDVGVGGLATAGGVGFLARRHGLTIDRVTAADVLLADGTVARASAEADADLLWGVRGAGASLGIVTSVELAAYPVGNVVFALMAFRAEADLLERWGAVVEAAPRELTSFLTVFAQGGETIAQLYSVYAGDDAEAASSALTPLLEIGPLVDQQAQLVPYDGLMRPHGGTHTGNAPGVVRSALLDHLTPDAARLMAEGVRSGAALMLQIRSVGGAVNDLHAGATAWAHRTQNFAVSAAGVREARLGELWAELAPPGTGMYAAFDTDRGPDRVHAAFPGATLTRLRELKWRYDPDGVFDGIVRIEPLAPASAAA